MKKINFFNAAHPLFSLRWVLLMGILSIGTLTYYNLTSQRLFDFSDQEETRSGNRLYHK